MEALEKAVKEKKVLSPAEWLDQALKLNVLRSEDDDKLFELESDVAKKKKEFIEGGMSVSQAKVYAEAEDIYKQMRKQKAFCDQITEFVKIAKRQAGIKEGEYYNP